METEIWPNTVAAARAHAVPLLLVNGRLSDKSLQQALRMAPLSYPPTARCRRCTRRRRKMPDVFAS